LTLNRGENINNTNLGQTIIITDTNNETIINICIKWLYNNNFKIILNTGSNVKARKIRRIFAVYFDLYLNQIDDKVNMNMLHYTDLNKEPLKNSILYLSLIKYIFKGLKRNVSPSIIKQLSNYPSI